MDTMIKMALPAFNGLEPGILNNPQSRKSLAQQRIVLLPTQLSNDAQKDEKLVLRLEANSFKYNTKYSCTVLINHHSIFQECNYYVK